MYISRFSRIGARALGSLLKAPLPSTARTSCVPLSQNRYLFPLQRGSFCSSAAGNASEESNEEDQTISVTFVDKDGKKQNIEVPLGTSILEAAHENDIELEGACEGSMNCSTCHVVVMDMEYYNKLEEPTDEEYEMLDLALGVTETSRLGCQLIANPELDGLRLTIPSFSRNVGIDGYKPKPC